jgi:DNA-binding LacI/PurR family transcriptional regulator
MAVVTVNRNEDSGRVSSVVNDEALGMRLSVDHLVALGHRRMVHLLGPQHLSTGHLRREGFLQALAAHGWMRRARSNARPIPGKRGASPATRRSTSIPTPALYWPATTCWRWVATTACARVDYVARKTCR